MQTIIEEKINPHEYMQELWDSIERPNQRINRVEEGAEIRTKGIRNLFKEITENFPNLCNNTGTHMQEAF
jgi:hypothetical protein